MSDSNLPSSAILANSMLDNLKCRIDSGDVGVRANQIAMDLIHMEVEGKLDFWQRRSLAEMLEML
jgi:hypothetical protein